MYLGLPLGAKQNSIAIWDTVIKRSEEKLAGWKVNRLILSGRVVLIKSVLASLPNYYLFVFSMLVSIKKKLDSIHSRFMWGGTVEKRKIHWVAWDLVCKPKQLGGLGIVDLRLKNKALLAKWLWRFVEDKDALWRCIISEKYGRNHRDLLPNTQNRNQFSMLWKNIMSLLKNSDEYAETLLSGLGVSIGNGMSILFWSQTEFRG